MIYAQLDVAKEMEPGKEFAYAKHYSQMEPIVELMLNVKLAGV